MRRILKWSLPILLVIIAMTGLWRFTLRCSGPAKDDGGERILSELANAKPLDTVKNNAGPSNISAATNETMWSSRALELAADYLSDHQKVSLEGFIERESRAPASDFATCTKRYQWLVEALKNTRRELDYYLALKALHDRFPNDSGILRMMLLVSSTFEQDPPETEDFLRILVAVKADFDVVWPLSEKLIEKGDPASAMSFVRKCARENPEQAAAAVSYGVSRSSELGLHDQYQGMIAEMKSTENQDLTFARRCGEAASRMSDFDNALYFYGQARELADSDFNRDLCTVKLAETHMAKGDSTSVDVDEIKTVYLRASSPLARRQAASLLIALKQEVPGQKVSGNDPNRKGK